MIIIRILPYFGFHKGLDRAHTETKSGTDKELLFVSCYVKVIPSFCKKEFIIYIYIRSDYNSVLPMPEIKQITRIASH